MTSHGSSTAGSPLRGKVALVTGGGAGIGEACAVRLAEAGARVAIADVDIDAARAVANRLGTEVALAVRVDVSDPASVDGMVGATVAHFGALHVAVNNAGVGGDRVPTADQTDEGWRNVMSVNLDGVFYCTRAEIRAMREQGEGSIVQMASILGTVGFPDAVAYVAAKHGIVGLTRTAALDHAADGIRVNAVAPGFIATPLLQEHMGPAEQAQVGALHPLDRLGRPAEVAELVVWLASDSSTFVTGALYTVDGGYTAR
jgi:2-dehydro-3-deoxy-L-rhamnonate dehydrogenase (NAD+)